MKYPLSERPFPSLRSLTPDQSAEFERVVHTLLHQTVREYEDFTYVSAGLLSKKRWKSIKHREALTVYRERADKDDFAPPAMATVDWGMPKLLMVGTIVGTLDDVMYGTIAPTTEAMRIRSAYNGDELLDCEVLDEINMPTPEHPFQFLGLKWSVRNHASPLSPMASPRDTVVVEGTGLHTLSNGERLGFRVVHSVYLPQYHDLKPLGFVRTRLSSTSLFRQLPNGTVDVYMTRFTEATGSMSESSVLTAAASSMISCWKSVWCSQNKKLACAAKDGALRWALEGAGQLERLVVTTDEEGKYCCGLCLKGYKLYNSVITCQACNLMVCSRCQVGRRLARVGYKDQITQYPVLFCKNCITRSTKESAWDVASTDCTVSDNATAKSEIQELQALRQRSVAANAAHDPAGKRTSRSRDASVYTNSTLSGSLDGFDPHSFSVSYDESDEDTYHHQGVDIQTADDWDRVHDQSFYMDAPPRVSASDTGELTSYNPAATGSGSSQRGGEDHQQQLWMQMTQLCMAAEKTYHITKKNADAMRQQMPSYS